LAKIAETYQHDHSLESSGGALSGGTISVSIQPFSGGTIRDHLQIIHSKSETKWNGFPFLPDFKIRS
jgi:hypothetical protein